MTITLFAQPYNMEAKGFYFTNEAEYRERAAACKDSLGQPVEEFEIQFIDGAHIDCDLARAVGLNQANLKNYLDAVAAWESDDKTRVILAVGACGYSFDATTGPSDFEIDIYPFDTMRDLAEHFVDEGLLGDIPEHLQFYIDYDAIARDLSMDYAEAEIAGTRLIFRRPWTRSINMRRFGRSANRVRALRILPHILA